MRCQSIRTLALVSASVISACQDLDGIRIVGDSHSIARSVEHLAAHDEYGEGVLSDGDGTVSTFSSSTRTELSADELAEVQREIASARARAGIASTRSPVSAKTATERVLDWAATVPPESEIQITLALADTDFSFSSLRTASSDARASLIDIRKNSLKPIQDSVERELIAIGGKVVRRHWLSNAITVLVPAGLAPRLLQVPNVISASPGSVTRTPGLAYNGDQIRPRSLASNLIAAGFDGESFGQSIYPSDNIKIGIFEDGSINSSHVGWKDTSAGISRIRSYYDCSSGSCILANPPTPAANDKHGTRVSWVAAGSIEQGQDPDYPGAATGFQRQRSGIAKEAEIYFFELSGSCTSSALEEAVSAGIDIVNMSYGDSCPGFSACDPAYDCCNNNAEMRAALDAGTLINACAGNCSAGVSGCNLWYPGFRPETVAVAMLDSSDSATAYDDLVVPSDACHGPVDITLRSGIEVTTAGVDITAPGVVRSYFGMGTDDYDVNNAVGGCSYATPLISGVAALLQHAFKDFGWDMTNPRALMVNTEGSPRFHTG